MTEEKLRELWYYVIQVIDDDRYLFEVYADDKLVCITNSREEAYDRLLMLAEWLQN